jgi:molybdenum cofactor biosynthesis enzyme MoaA
MGEAMVWRPNIYLNQIDELLTLVRVIEELGFDKYHFAGGEPATRSVG